jgi:hypothetical protein
MMRRKTQGIPDTPRSREHGRLTAHHSRRFRTPEPFFRAWPDEPRPSLFRRLSPAFDQSIVQQVYLRPTIV